jgi:hypothetical protein
MNMIGSPGLITPPMVCAASLSTTPSVLDVGQLVAGRAAGVLVHLDDLQLGLGDTALGLGRRGAELGDVAAQLHRGALQRVQPGERHQLLIIELADAFQLRADQLDLLLLGLDLLAVADDLLLQLLDALAQLVLLASVGLDVQLVEPLLLAHQVAHGRIGAAAQHLGGPDQRLAVALGLQARLAGGELVHRGADDGVVGGDLGRVQGQEHVALAHMTAVGDADLLHHAAGGMLDLLDVGGDHDLAGRDHRAVHGGDGGQPSQHEHQEAEHEHAQAHVVLDRSLRIEGDRRFSHAKLTWRRWPSPQV